MKRVGVLTSGGDAPGMNAAIRAVVRAGVDRGWEVFGVRHGYAGLIAGNFNPLGVRNVGGIIQQGGTMLGSSRSPEFMTERGRVEALHQLAQHDIGALVVIGGNGSQQGAHALAELGFRVIGLASTIDNDLYGTEISIGVDTALNIAVEAIDRLKITASSHRRASLVEVMGRECGYLALMAGIAGGAETVVIPEKETEPEGVAAEIREAYLRGKNHALVVIAEGAHCNASRLMAYFNKQEEEIGFEPRATILGHVQRGGSPTTFDRLLATRLGCEAVEYLDRGERSLLLGWNKGRVTATALSEVVTTKKPLDIQLLALLKVLGK